MTPREIAIKVLDQARSIAMSKIFVDATDDLEASIKLLIADAIPREPTDAMLDAGYMESLPIDGAIAYVVVGNIWRAMYDAAKKDRR